MNTNDKLNARIKTTEMNIESLRTDLANEAQSLADRMKLVVLKLEEGLGVNSLGEVQRRGQEVDRLCALLDAEEKNLVMLNWIATEEA